MTPATLAAQAARAARVGARVAHADRGWSRRRAFGRLIAVVGLLSRPLVAATWRGLSAPTSRDLAWAAFGRDLRRSFRDLGGAWPKVGQLLSYRTDVLPARLCAELAGLIDGPIPAAYSVAEELERELGERAADLTAIDLAPTNSGTVADVFMGYHRTAGPVAVKLIRPGVRDRFALDLGMLGVVVRLVRAARWWRLQAAGDVLELVILLMDGQLDLRAEADWMERYVAGAPGGVRVPSLVSELVTRDVMVMERIEPLMSLLGPDPAGARRRDAARGLEALYRMLFIGRVLHCDLHPGNLLRGNDGEIVILDFGICHGLSPDQSRKFKRFFFGLAAGRPEVVAEVLRGACRLHGPDFDAAAFDRDIEHLVAATHGAVVRDFQIALFVGRLFVILGRHRMSADADFFMPVLSLLVFEGVLKSVGGELPFLRIAAPYLFDLAMADVMAMNRGPDHPAFAIAGPRAGGAP